MKAELSLLDAIDALAQRGLIEHCVAFVGAYEGSAAWEQLWQPLVQRYGLRHPLAVVDSRHCDAGSALGAHVLRVHTKGRFRPQLLLAARADAVLLCHGSFDFTRGGLGDSRGLVSTLTFSTEGSDTSSRVLLSAVSFLTKHVLPLLESAHPESLALVEAALMHAQWIGEGLSENAGLQELDLVHTGDAPLWPQLLARLGDQALKRVVALGPLLDEGPHSGPDDGSWLRRLEKDLVPPKRSAVPALQLFAGGAQAYRGHEPILGTAKLELLRQDLREMPVLNRGRLLYLEAGRRKALCWGSADPTSSGLLRSVRDGQYECSFVLASNELEADAVLERFGLDRAFVRCDEGEIAFAEQEAVEHPPPFALTELLYDPVERTLFLGGLNLRAGQHVEVLSPDGELLLAAHTVRSEELEGSIARLQVTAPLEATDSSTQRRSLSHSTLRVRVRDQEAGVVGEVTLRPNVRFDDALEVFENLLLRDEALRADEMLVPLSGPSEGRYRALEARVAWLRRLSGEHSEKLEMHRAQLDQFFDNVRRGLGLHRSALWQSQGARHLLLRWSREMQRCLHSLCGSTQVDGASALFMVTRIAELVADVMNRGRDWQLDRRVLLKAIEGERLKQALEQAADSIRGLDPELVAAELAQCREVCGRLERKR